ncbi:MAG: type II toxin-antitoxin system RelE/ParE family toxin [Terracidiphilus sp.]|jgi:plasmid stabilization system protein ParE
MNGYVLGTAAELDLDEIWEYIVQDSIQAADRWIGKLFDAFEALVRNPGIGHKREDLTAYPILFWPVGSYLILYRVQSERIEIVAVTQGGRDFCVNAFTSEPPALRDSHNLPL